MWMSGCRKDWPNAWKEKEERGERWRRQKKGGGDGASPDLHGGGELGLVFHVVLGEPSLDARQHRRFEEVPPVLVQYLV